MDLRITKDGLEKDIAEIHALLKEYHLAKIEAYEDSKGKKLAGLRGNPLEPSFASNISLSAMNYVAGESEKRLWRLQVCLCGYIQFSGTGVTPNDLLNDFSVN